MVKQVFGLLKREISGLHEAAYLLAGFSILSQILALVRDRLLTYFFGAGTELDIYYAAFKVPDTVFVMVASIVSVSVLVPIIIEKSDKSFEEEKRFVDSIFSFFSIFMVGISVIVWIFMPEILNMIYRGMNPEKLDSVISMSRILLLQPFILGFANLFGSIAQAHKQFIVYASGPVLYNAGIIIGIIAFYPTFGLSGLVYGVILGACLHLAIQLPAVFSNSLIPRFRKFDITLLKEIITLSLPRTISLGIGTVAILFLTALASSMVDGSIAILTLAINLEGVPLTVVGMSYSLAAFPALSRMFGKGNIAGFLAEISSSMKHIIFWSFPIIVLFVVLRAQIVRVVLGAGSKFTWSDTKLTAALFAILALAVLAQSVVLLITRAFYAARITAEPLIINMISAILTVVFSLTFLDLFKNSIPFREFVLNITRVDGVAGSEVLMLGLGFMLAYIINALVLWFVFVKKFKGDYSGLSKTFIQSFLSSLIMGIVAYYALDIFDEIFNLETTFGIFMQGFVSGIIGIFIGILSLVFMKSKEIKEIWENLHHKFWKVKPELAGPDTL